MNYTHAFDIYFIAIAAVWVIALLLITLPLPRKYLITGHILLSLGIMVLIAFLTLLWINIQRPPMRTLGETRLWYSLLLSLVGYFIYWHWKYKWFLTFSLVVALLFLYINYRFPENFDKTLMPALQSRWFIPHVIVYILAYAFLIAASLVAYKGIGELIFRKFRPETLTMADNLVYIGFAFLTSGLILGALWAKEAWGHYWTWDPKETWAALTWFTYIIYIHLRYNHPSNRLLHLCFLSLASIVLLFCWMGLNFLPIAMNSIHLFTN